MNILFLHLGKENLSFLKKKQDASGTYMVVEQSDEVTRSHTKACVHANSCIHLKEGKARKRKKEQLEISHHTCRMEGRLNYRKHLLSVFKKSPTTNINWGYICGR